MAVLARLRRRFSSFHGSRRNAGHANPTSMPEKTSPSSVSAAQSGTPNGVASRKGDAIAVTGASVPPTAGQGAAGAAKSAKPIAPPKASKRTSRLTKKPVSEPHELPPWKAGVSLYEEKLYDPAQRSLVGPKSDLAPLYPPIEPYEQGKLRVSSVHELYWEWSGNPKGSPAVFIHGGPGAGCTPDDRRWFDPKHYRILCLDQRGAGRSTPQGETRENTTADLIADLEFVRKHFSINRWVVMGHSWGSALSLAYAEAHPTSVSALILAGVFSARPSGAAFFLEGKGTAHLFPDLWDAFQSFIPPAERSDLIRAYHARLNSTDPLTRAEAAYHWTTYEWAVCNFYVDPAAVQTSAPPMGKEDIAMAQMEVHYFANGCFLKPGQLLEPAALDKIRHIPIHIVQGRYDAICPPSTAWELHRLWPEASFSLVPDAGHTTAHPGLTSALVKATDLFKGLAPPPKTFSARTRGAAAHAHAIAASHGHRTDGLEPIHSPLLNGYGLSETSGRGSIASSPVGGSARVLSTSIRYSPLRVTGQPSYRRQSMRLDSRRNSSMRLPSSAPDMREGVKRRASERLSGAW